MFLFNSAVIEKEYLANKILIISMEGKIIESIIPLTNRTALNVKNIPNEFYLVRILNNSSVSSQRLVIKLDAKDTFYYHIHLSNLLCACSSA